MFGERVPGGGGSYGEDPVTLGCLVLDDDRRLTSECAVDGGAGGP